jgi:hypothetical protein
MQFKRLAQVIKSFFFGAALAGNIYVEALGDEPRSFAPHGGRKRTLHNTILPQFFRDSIGDSGRVVGSQATRSAVPWLS